MQEVLQNINIMELLSMLWTMVLVPILSYVGKQVYDCLKDRKLNKYGVILYDEVVKAVKSVYETSVKDIKHTSDWTIEKQNEVKELAKTKTIQALSSSVYKILKEANEDFEEYLDSLVGTALFDIKNNNV